MESTYVYRARHIYHWLQRIQHLAVSPERAGMVRFTNEITKAGYSQSKMLFRIRWEEPVNYILLDQIIRFNCIDKAECKTLWRK